LPWISCGRPARSVEALEAAVVERQHVVAGRLDQEQALQVAQLVGLVRG
jgi:hypothetical protein